MDMEGDMKCCARTPCCSKVGLNRGPWSPDEDHLLSKYIQTFGEGRWRTLPKKAGLKRCGKSCRLRWMNYLRPDVKRGYISPEEEDLILRLHRLLGNRWSLIAGRIPGRTDNEIKNYWNTHLKKKLLSQGIDPKTHKAIPPERLALSEIHKPQKSTKIVSTKAANAKQENLIANHNHEMFMLMQQRDKLLPVFNPSTENLKLPSTGFGSMVNNGNFYHRQKPVVTRTTLDGEFNSIKQNGTDPYNQSLIIKHDLKPVIHQQDHYQNPATSVPIPMPPLLLHEMYTSASETTRPRNSSTSCFNPLMSINNFSIDTLAKHDHIAAFDNTGHNYDGNNTTLQSHDNALGFLEGIKHSGSGVSCSSSATQVSSDHMFLQRWQHLHKSSSENLASSEANNMMMMMMSNEKLTAPSLELSHSNHGYLYPGVFLNNSVPIPSAFSAFSSPGSPSSRLLQPANLICDPSWVASNNHPNA